MFSPSIYFFCHMCVLLLCLGSIHHPRSHLALGIIPFSPCLCCGISQDKLFIYSDLKTVQQCSDPDGCFMDVGVSCQSLSLQGRSLHFTCYPMQDALNRDIFLSCTLYPNARSVLLSTEAPSPNHSFHWRHNPLLPTRWTYNEITLEREKEKGVEQERGDGLKEDRKGRKRKRF